MRFWLWADSVSVDGVVDGVASRDIDAIVDAVGFSECLSRVGWLTFDDDIERIHIPNFDRHNGETAKKRAQKAKRQAKWRENRVDAPVDAPPSTRAPLEKRREDKKKSTKRKFIPPAVDEVRAYCQERRNGIDPEHFVDHYEARGWKLKGGDSAGIPPEIPWFFPLLPQRGKSCFPSWMSRVRVPSRSFSLHLAKRYAICENGGMSIVSEIPGFLTVAEVADRLRVSHSQAARYIRDGKLPAKKIGNTYLINETDLQSFSRPPMGNPNLQRRQKSPA